MRRSKDLLLCSAAVVLLLVAGVGLAESASWIGKPFPGFLILENRVVASAGLPHWPAVAGGEIYQHEIVAVDGVPLESAHALHQLVRSRPPGTRFTYRFHAGAHQLERAIPSRRFGGLDFALLFGVYLLNGLALGGTALGIRYLCGRHPLANATLPVLLVSGLWSLTAMDLYGPSRLFRLHALCEVLIFPAALHMALRFPHPTRLTRNRPWLVAMPYVLALGGAGVYQVGLERPSIYVNAHLVATSALGVSLLALIASQVWRYVRIESPEVRAAIRVLALGAVVALTLPVCLTLAEPFTGGRFSQNALGFTAFVFPLSVGYTVLRRSVLDLKASG